MPKFESKKMTRRNDFLIGLIERWNKFLFDLKLAKSNVYLFKSLLQFLKFGAV